MFLDKIFFVAAAIAGALLISPPAAAHPGANSPVQPRQQTALVGHHCGSPSVSRPGHPAAHQADIRCAERVPQDVHRQAGAGDTSASGPGAPGKEVVLITCEGLGTVPLSIQRGDNSNGAAQIVDAKGHAIPVDATFTLTDLTTATVLGTEMTATGNGHPNQSATHCSGILFQGSASDFFGTELPPGAAPTDTVQLTIDAFAVIKL
jgi:hypothetical protein